MSCIDESRVEMILLVAKECFDKEDTAYDRIQCLKCTDEFAETSLSRSTLPHTNQTRCRGPGNSLHLLLVAILYRSQIPQGRAGWYIYEGNSDILSVKKCVL